MYEDEDSDCLDFGGDSDDDRADSESSEDDLDVLLKATPEKRRKLQQQRQKQTQPEDDFEREMNAELQETVSAIEAERRHIGRGHGDPHEDNPETSTSGDTANSANTGSTKYYDDVYFDSDDEENDQGGVISPNRKRPVPSNDDLLYDPNMDAEDEKWVTQQRQKCRPKDSQSKKEGEKKTPLPRSDAVLDCPACMTTLCRDCQRHDVYDNQYRAMFVTNCVVDTSELLKFPEQKVKKKKKSKQDMGDCGDNDKYNPVKCEECNTVVAMYDSDEIYHFFNVLASYS